MQVLVAPCKSILVLLLGLQNLPLDAISCPFEFEVKTDVDSYRVKVDDFSFVDIDPEDHYFEDDLEREDVLTVVLGDYSVLRLHRQL